MAQKQPEKKTSPSFIVTRQQLASLLGCSADSLTRWAGEGMPVKTVGGGRGKPTLYDLAAVLPWLLNREGEATAREQYYEAQTRKLDFDLAVKRGEYIAVDEAQRDGASVARAVQMKLRLIPHAQIDQVLTIGARDGRAPAAAFLLRAVDSALRELAALGDPEPKAEAS